MSFDVFLQYVERDPPLDAAAANVNVAGVVHRFGGGQADEFGYFFDLQDGGSVELYANAKVNSAMFALRGITPQLCRLVFETMKDTGWVALIPNERLCVASVRDLPRETLEEGVPELTVIKNEEDLMQLLSPGFAGWSANRAQVVKGI